MEVIKWIQVLTNHKSIIYFQTQSHLSRIQSKWIEFLGNYNLIIQHCSRKDILNADALFKLFIRSSTGDKVLNPNWPMIYNFILKQELPPGTLPKSRDMVIQNKHLFPNEKGDILRRLDNGNLVPYRSVSQRFETIYQFHRELGFNKASNLIDFLCLKVRWPSLAYNVLKYSLSTLISRSTLSW